MSWIETDDMFRQIEYSWAHLPRFDNAAKIISCIFVCTLDRLMDQHRGWALTHILQNKIWVP
jgi:hypothetical protein